MSTITIYSDLESWVTGVADFITELATKAIAERGRFTFAYSGGSTPRPVCTSPLCFRRRSSSRLTANCAGRWTPPRPHT